MIPSRPRTRFPVESFELVSADLRPEHLEKNPLWAENYDFEERDEIESWGVDRAWLDSELKRLPDHPHPIYPVLVHDPFPDRMYLFISAAFRTPNGHELTGYLINSPPHAVHIFLPRGGEVLNINMIGDEYWQRSIDSIRAHVGDKDDPIHPLTYRSDVRGRDGEPIHGVFD